MNIVDVIIILFIVFGALIGFKQGFTRSLVDFCGYIIVVILAFIFKNPVSEFMMTYLPFFDFWGFVKGVSVLNIVLYEGIAFLFVFGILMIGLRLLFRFTSIFEKILNATIILGIPSKILGAVMGALKSFVTVFIVLYILNLPMFASYNFITDSTYKDKILENTPVLSMFADDMVLVVNDFYDISLKYKNTSNSNKFNYDTLNIFLKYGVVKPKTVNILLDKNKLHIDGARELAGKYEEE